jgi:hypothetical protein
MAAALRTITKRRWQGADAELGLPAIRLLHLPANRHRVSLQREPRGATVVGTMRAGTCYVLAGSCTFACDGTTVALARGDIADLPEGEYAYATTSDEDAVLVKAWVLPSEERPPS